MNNFKKHIAVIHEHMKKAESKHRDGIAVINPDTTSMSDACRILNVARACSNEEQRCGRCSYANTIAEEVAEAMVAAGNGNWAECYDELADAGCVVLRTMELIYPRIKDKETYDE
jgi:septum formation inhibitor-activating ATPase MinD